MINTPELQMKKAYNGMSPARQFLYFILIFIGIFIVGNVVGVLISIALYGSNVLVEMAQLNFASPHVVASLWIVQLAGTTIPIAAAPAFFAFVVVRQPENYLKTSFKFPLMLLVIIFFMMFINLPLIEYLSNINQKMVLPGFLKGLQQWMKEKEDQTQAVELAMFKMDTIGAMIKNLIIIGLFTAIAEELMFRGVIQTIFARWTKSNHAAIWITAILFSAFHMQFFGFLPRVFLGALFGYFVVWSGSLWTSIWAHFINNGTIVVVTYLYQQKATAVNPDEQHLFTPVFYAMSLLIVLFLLYLYRYINLNKKPLPTD